jgi:hypothetical protein
MMAEEWSFAPLPAEGSWLVDAAVQLFTLHGSLVSRRCILTPGYLVFGEGSDPHPSIARAGSALDWIPLHEVSCCSSNLVIMPPVLCVVLSDLILHRRSLSWQSGWSTTRSC